MADETPAPSPPAVSPTGKPLVPPAVVPYLIAALGVVGALLAVALPIDPDGAGPLPAVAMLPVLAPYAGWLGLIEALLLAAVGAGPGIRRAAPILLVVLGASTLTGCSAAQRVGKATVDCAVPALQARVTDLVPAVLDQLGKPTQDWSAALDVLVMSAGDAGICAVKAVVAELQRAPATPTAWTASYLVSPGDLQLRRGQRWLQVNGYPSP